MDVVSHQDIGMNRAVILRRSLLESIEVETVIALGKEDRLPIVTALNNVLGQPRHQVPWQSSHFANPFAK
jgi:hypothetical protein